MERETNTSPLTPAEEHEVSGPPESWEMADLDEAISRLVLPPPSSSKNETQDSSDPSLLGFVDDHSKDDAAAATSTASPHLSSISSSRNTTSSSSVSASNQFSSNPTEEQINQVDQFLREALQKPRERLSILRMEQDILTFIRDPRQQQLEFTALPTSYLRLAAHRAAQHYSLQSIAVPDNNVADGSGSRIILFKNVQCRLPLVRLSDIPLELPQADKSKLGKIAIKQRSQKCSQTINTTGNNSKTNQLRSVEERKEEYNRARARIFNSSSGGFEVGLKSEDNPNMSSSLQHLHPVMKQTEEKGFVREHDSNLVRHFAESSTSRVRIEEPVVNKQKTSNKVAILRDREVDRKDPDYDRSYDRYAQRFEPGFGFSGAPYSMQAVYSPAVNYNTEFPQLGSSHRPQISIDPHGRQIPQHLNTWIYPGYVPPEGMMTPFPTNQVALHSTSPLFLQSPYVPGLHPAVAFVHHEHPQPFTQIHQPQSETNYGSSRPR
ncbi:putative R3h domain containing protein [Zostera marina]|uniref:Putative R3h domain containing protein n=1 Tax=Zostera marina TaxID=29655 RepID=A0A0K9NJP8_ZOSMR|nr:putative R3h domain containing protein [Zostera marina]